MDPLLLLVIGGIIVACGDILLKKWATLHVSMVDPVFVAGMLVSMLGIVFLSWAFRSKGLATANSIFVAINTVALLAAHIFYFQEKLSWIQGIGISLAILSVVLIEFGEIA